MGFANGLLRRNPPHLEGYRELSGWGRTPRSGANVHRPATVDDVRRALAASPRRGLIPRGLGRSYGDAAQNAGGTVLLLTDLRRVHDLDLRTGRITVDAGASLDALMRVIVPLGWFVPVSPGTRHVTVGGAIAADIHGKNHHREGSFGRHVDEIELLLPSGEVITAGPDDDAFRATVGGMGLTGIILRATFRLFPIETSFVRVDTERAADLEDLLDRMERRDDAYRYSVAWIDCLAGGRRLGRGVLTRGDHAEVDDLPTRHSEDPLHHAPATRLSVPWAPSGLLNKLTIRAFNELWFRKAPQLERGAIQTIPSYFHPLDGIAHWNRLYGRTGFLQYQLVVPFGEETALRRIVERLSSAGCSSFLAVLKRFGPGNGLLSFPMAGWTLSLDIPAALGGLAELLDDLDEHVAKAGGRIYFAKDSRLRPELVGDMYPQLPRWQEIRGRLDPDSRMVSDLGRRLGLT